MVEQKQVEVLFFVADNIKSVWNGNLLDKNMSRRNIHIGTLTE